jgi:hypothetical protein
MDNRTLNFWACGKLGKSNSPPNNKISGGYIFRHPLMYQPPPRKGIKKFRFAHSVWGRRRKKSNVFKHPPPI